MIPIVSLILFTQRKKINQDNLSLILGGWIFTSIILMSFIIANYST